MSRSSVLASLASQDVSASEFDKLDADNGSDYQGQIDLKSPLASPTFTGSITTPEIRSGSTLTIDPATVGDNTGLVLLKGNLQVDGTSTTINSTTLTVDDLNLTLASGAADSAAANGAGITIDGASATMTYTHSTTSFDFNKPVNAINTAQVTGTEGTSASLYLIADEGDDNGDGWRINSNQDVNDLTISNNTSGSYVDKLTITSAGKVGINQTGPASLLTVGSVADNNSANTPLGKVGQDPAILINNSSHVNSESQLLFGYNSGSETYAPVAISYKNTSASSKGKGHLLFATRDATTDSAPSERMRIDSSGNVGIATGSNTLTEKLRVDGAVAITGQLQSHQTSAMALHQTSSTISEIRVYGADDSTAGTFRIRGYANDGSPFYEGVYIRSDGNLGINETNPTLPLHISHSSSNTTINDNSAAHCGIMLQNTSNTDGAYTGIWSQDADNDATNAGIIFKNVSQSDSTASMHFLTRPSGSGAQEVMTIDKDGNVIVGNIKVDTIEGDTFYRSKHYQFFPYYDNYQINTGSSAWTQVTKLNGPWGSGSSIFQKTFNPPPAGFTEKFYLGVAGGTGSSGSANLRVKFIFEDGSDSYESIAETQIVSGWHSAAAMYHFIAEIVPVTISSTSTTLRTFLSAGSLRSGALYFKNTYGAGNVGISHVWIEQRIYFS